MDSPSPNTSSVTPCLMSLCDRPSTSRDSVAQLSMLMKPGVTAMPVASTSLVAWAPLKSPTAATVSPRMPTSACTPGVPEPSYTVPPRTITS